jgi:hypothetical protein
LYKLIYLARRSPNVLRQDWPETWCSHARFTTQFQMMQDAISYSRYCNRIDVPLVDGQAVELTGLSVEHDGVAVAASVHIEAIQGGAFTTGQRALIQQDELRVFDRLTPDFAYYATEAPVRDGQLGGAAIYRFLVRKPDVPRLMLKERLAGSHSHIVQAAIEANDAVTRYTHNLPLHRPLPLFPFDAISECWFATPGNAVQAWHERLFAAVNDDLSEFCDLGRSVTMLTHVIHSVGEPV